MLFTFIISQRSSRVEKVEYAKTQFRRLQKAANSPPLQAENVSAFISNLNAKS